MNKKDSTSVRVERINLRFFDIKKCFTTADGSWTHPTGVIYGFRKTGKSTKLVSLLYETKDVYGTCYRFSPTADNKRPDGTKVYGSIFPRTYCWKVPSDEQLIQIQKFQRYLLSGGLPNLNKKDLNCLIIFDDLSSKKKVAGSPVVAEFASTCRNDFITFLLCVQYFNQIPPAVRSNIDFFMTNNERNDETKSKLRREIFSMFKDDDIFRQAMSYYCANYGSLVWANINGAGFELNDCVFLYKATHLIGDFTLDVRICNMIDKALGKSDQQIDDMIQADILKTMDEMDEKLDDIEDNEDKPIKKRKRSTLIEEKIEKVNRKSNNKKSKPSYLHSRDRVFHFSNEEDKEL